MNQQRLKELLHYDPITGIFTWLVSTAPCNKIGDIAGGLCNTSGYIFIGIDNEILRAHRLAFLYMEGKYPPKHVDHINHIRNDNAWNNLRKCDNQMNQRNSSKRIDNTSKVTGVSWHKRANKYQAILKINNKQKHLGYFSEYWDAVCTRMSANNKYNFHINHGK